MSFCDNCFKSVTHDGTPEGKRENIGGVECYIATPTVDYPKDKVVLFLTDVFGLAPNNLLLADDFARNGFMTIIPDMFNGDPYPVNYGKPDAPPFDREKWFSAHGAAAQIRPQIDSVIAALKADGVTGFAATGYCLGARYVFDLAFDGFIRASAISHPGRLEVPADLNYDYFDAHVALQKYAATSTAPLLINSCTTDPPFPAEAQAEADVIFGGGKFAPGYKRAHFEGCTHGFAVRGDMSDPVVRAGKEGAFKASIEWFMKYL